MLVGCLLNCLPAALSCLFLRVVAAYSELDRDLMALAGKYLSPVLEEGLPDLVPHFCLVQLAKDFCDFFRDMLYLYELVAFCFSC